MIAFWSCVLPPHPPQSLPHTHTHTHTLPQSETHHLYRVHEFRARQKNFVMAELSSQNVARLPSRHFISISHTPLVHPSLPPSLSFYSPSRVILLGVFPTINFSLSPSQSECGDRRASIYRERNQLSCGNGHRRRRINRSRVIL